MVFSSLQFVYLYLPLVLSAYFVLPRSWRNAFLLSASLLFYGWGEGWYAFVMVASMVFNWVAGLVLEMAPGRKRLTLLYGAIGVNLAALLYFKYANFFADNLDVALRAASLQPLSLAHIHLPIGISFFTFQAISYVVDVARADVKAQRNLIDYGMYKALFPQLIAGPIVRYRDVAGEVGARRTSVEDIASGVARFVVGLGKKMLIANVVAVPADFVFGLPPSELSTTLAWYGALCYALQIYFDFSAYSDMAIGIGRILGFHFLENFNFPYAAASVRDFWRRWHISLSTWFRDYLYIPLGGDRCAAWRNAFNLLLVFLLCGFWHGANWTFIVWGLWHGAFLAAERWGGARLLHAMPRLLQHAYTMVVVLVGWVFFRADTLSHAGGMLRAMVGLGTVPADAPWPMDATSLEVQFVMICAVLAALKVPVAVYRWLETASAHRLWFGFAWQTARFAGLGAVMYFSTAALVAGSFNPFIYFRF